MKTETVQQMVEQPKTEGIVDAKPVKISSKKKKNNGSFRLPKLLKRTPFYIIAISCTIQVAHFLITSFQRLDHWSETVKYFTIAYFFYPLVEYISHAYFFHYIENIPSVSKAYYVVHGAHHVFPNKGITLPLINHWAVSIIWNVMFHQVFGSQYGPAISAGSVLGYGMFEFSHYYSHSKLNWKLLEPLREYHEQHHKLSKHTAYGFVSPFWDFVLGTLPPGITPYTMELYQGELRQTVAKILLYMPIPMPFYHFAISAMLRNNEKLIQEAQAVKRLTQLK